MKFVELEITQDGQSTEISLVDLSDFFNDKIEDVLSMIEKEIFIPRLDKSFKVKFKLKKEGTESFKLFIDGEGFNNFWIITGIVVFIVIIIVVLVFMNLNTNKKKRKFVDK